MTALHTIERIDLVLAARPGDLSGFAAVCSCGARIESSLVVLARSWGTDHCRYYNARRTVTA